ncbi:MAG: lipoyltransferase, partial [Muribaculaceae bacterium]|nr:lipoyltransferase [Muribaculaceae bacterium]
MIHLKIDDKSARQLPFYLAMEEWAAKRLPADDYFFSWQVNPTVIFGRNQCIDAEVNLDYCRENHIETYRRKSGGGCVFADRHNIMFSYITPSEHVTTTFSRYTEMIAGMLRSLGIDAQATGRNDITIDGRKVSGNAFYHIPGRSIVHGTMLYDTDLRHMANAITPSRSKLESKQVQSVEAHITTLSRYLDMSLDDFHCYAIKHLTDRELKLTTNQIAEIEELSLPYYEPDWIFGRRSAAKIHHTRRIEGVGEMSTAIQLHEGRITDINIDGDFFLLSDLDAT